jgi:acetyltransferase-like isoleucine patch superfamily enzyme/SAM-dependent methyltransferase
MKFKESTLAHRLLDGLEGIEIGGSAHNPFGLRTRNVDFTSEITYFKQEEIKLCGAALPVDIVSPGDNLPLNDNSVDFVVSSHVIEHFPDPIKALREWYRVVKPGGYLYVIAPHKERTFDKERPRTTLAELIERHNTGVQPENLAEHCSVWITQDFVELIRWLGWTILEVQDVDDKVGNGFAVAIGVEKDGISKLNAAASESALSVFPPGPLWTHLERFAPVPAAARPQPQPSAPAAVASKQPPKNVAFGRSDPSLPAYVEIGAHTYYVPSETQFFGYIPGEKIIIGKYCSIAHEVTIFVGGNHSTDTVSTYPFDTWFLGRSLPTRSYKTSRNTEIGSDVWIGHGAHIAGGVHIGHGAVIASQAAVFTDVPPYGIAVGNPARVNRYRFSESIIESLLRIAWWDWPDDVVRRNVEWFYSPIAEFIRQFDPAGESSRSAGERTSIACR